MTRIVKASRVRESELLAMTDQTLARLRLPCHGPHPTVGSRAAGVSRLGRPPFARVILDCFGNQHRRLLAATGKLHTTYPAASCEQGGTVTYPSSPRFTPILMFNIHTPIGLWLVCSWSFIHWCSSLGDPATVSIATSGSALSHGTSSNSGIHFNTLARRGPPKVPCDLCETPDCSAHQHDELPLQPLCVTADTAIPRSEFRSPCGAVYKLVPH